MSDPCVNQDIDNLLEDCRQEHEFQERMARLQEPDELASVTRQRDALLAACREMLLYVEKASEVMFPNLADNEAIAEDARAAIALCQETPK